MLARNESSGQFLDPYLINAMCAYDDSACFSSKGTEEFFQVEAWN